MTLNLIPWPADVRLEGGALRPADLRGVRALGPGAEFPARQIAALLGPESRPTATEGPGVVVEETPVGAGGPEGYTLRLGAHGLHLSGPPAGLARGVATVEQLLEGAPAQLPHLTIRDAPRFAYRGMMLDVSRHFMPLGEVRALIDELARLKFNTFHWHLTDDQGWRLEILRYPRLTEVGAWRERTLIGHTDRPPHRYDDTPHGGFYTQAQVRELVAHAAARHITVIPEIDLPGHAQAAQAAYPELSCARRPGKVWERWGISPEVYCARDATFTFLEGVLDEVLELFPARTVHIGGDEVIHDHWRACPDCQAVMRREGLSDVAELEGYFTRRIARFLAGRGARAIAWDEVTDHRAPEGVTVMSWRGFAGGVRAARAGLDVIMAPQTQVYLDHYQGDPATEPLAIGGRSDLAHVYAFDPVPPELSAAEARRVLGGQANLWREYLPDTASVQYMAFPRLHAVAEALWTGPARDWAAFRARLPGVLAGLSRRGVGFRPPDDAPGG